MNSPTHCASCGVQLAPGRVLCVQCGWHAVTGRTIPAAQYPDGLTPPLMRVLALGAGLLISLVILWAPAPSVSRDAPTVEPSTAPVMLPDDGDWGRDIDDIPEPPTRRRPLDPFR
jgi:hypothetical protein